MNGATLHVNAGSLLVLRRNTTAEHQIVVDQKAYPVWQAPDKSRKVNLQVSKETCGGEHLSAGLFWLAPGQKTEADIHPDAEEIYYVGGR